MVRVGVIGHTGRLGKTLVEILTDHPEAEIVYRESRSEGVDGRLSRCETVFLALPAKQSIERAKTLRGKRIIDLSPAHRANESWVYGLSEVNREVIAVARKIANPGCYATSVILGLLPLVGYMSDLNIASTSGYSGTGSYPQDEDNFEVYSEGTEHYQISEIQGIIGQYHILFVPQRVHTADRGIVSTIFAEYHGGKDPMNFFRDFYRDNPFIRLVDSIETKNVIGTNHCDIKVMKADGKVVVISALDNLMKGGAGQAVQNFN